MFERRTLRHGANLLCGLALLSGTLRSDPGADKSQAHLSDTGLYSDFAAKTIARTNSPFSPQYPLWSDGAAKSRWIYLPPGTTIDARNEDNWIFPVGTKFWKEFSFAGKRVETRLLEKIGENEWTYQTYAWNADENDAVLVSEYGSRNHVEIAHGIRHDIPGVNDCKACHEGQGRDVVLGFNALQLSPDRDSLAPHAEKITPAMIDLQDLIEQKKFDHLAADFVKTPPRIHANSPRERAALGYLWANCGGCHNASDPLASVGMILKSPLNGDSATLESNRQTVIGHLSKFQIPELPAGETYRVLPGDPTHSSLVYRMGTRNPNRQMPALGTKIVDQQALDLITQWVQNDLGKQAQETK